MTDQYELIKRAAERSAEQALKASGRRELYLASLKKSFGVDSVEEAQRLLEKKRRQLKKKNLRNEKRLKKFMKEWKNEIQQLTDDD